MSAPIESERQLLQEGEALRRLARSLLGNGADADDLVQDTFAASLASPRHDAGARPWLRATLRNLALLWRRTTMRRTARERLAAQAERQTACDPAAIAAQSELLRCVVTAVHELEEPFRTVVVLRFWRGLLPEAIARELGVPRNTVRSRLQRGLERLRTRLDRAHGSRQGWTAPLGAMLGWRAVAPTAAATATMTLFAGMLMNTKLLLTAGILLVAAVAIPWSLAPAHPAAPPIASAAETPGAPVADASEPPVQRVELPTSSAAKPNAIAADEGPFDPSPVHVEPWSPDLLVVDEDDNPVADATIEVFEGTKVERSADVRQRYGGPRHAYQGHAPQPTLTLHTDTDGRARPVLDLENYSFTAHKDGVGQSLDEICWHTRSTCLKLVLCGTTTLRGTVLRADGLPASGAVVTTSPTSRAVAPGDPAPVTTDADGRFQISMAGRGRWGFVARQGDQRSFQVRADLRGEPSHELTLRFPGAITVSGLVIDCEGHAVADALVGVWRDYAPHPDDSDRDDAERGQTNTDAQGRFTLAVQRFARYQLFASAKAHATSSPQWLETSPGVPHADVRLQLPAFAVISGHVLHDDGSACPGARVHAMADGGHDPSSDARPGRDDLFPAPQAIQTDSDGSFALQVTPGSGYTLRAWPVAGNWQLCKTVPGVTPGTTEMVITITDDDLVGCIVRGSIVSAADGAPVEGQDVQLITYGDGDRPISTGDCGAKVDGHRFTLPALPLGERFGLRVSAPMRTDFLSGAFAPTDYGPFTTGRQGLEVEVGMQPWGDLPVRVLAADGSVPRDVSVLAFSDQLAVSYPSLHLDAEGRVLLQRRMPGLQHLRVFAGGDRLLLEQDVTILPGRNPELEVRLPAPSRSPIKR